MDFKSQAGVQLCVETLLFVDSQFSIDCLIRGWHDRKLGPCTLDIGTLDEAAGRNGAYFIRFLDSRDGGMK